MLQQIIEMLKKQQTFVTIYERIFQRPILNIFNKKHNKSALISYSTYHFKKKNYTPHSNYQESVFMANALDELGYNVDIENNNRFSKLDLSKYDLIIGEGIPLFQAAATFSPAIRVFYATGSHPWQCNNASLGRLTDYFNKYKKLPLESLRINDYRWGIAANAADAIICIGNDYTISTFIDYGCKNIYRINPTYHTNNDFTNKSLEQIEKSRKTALWFGSYGLLHKGLDITIEAFSKRPDWTLHVCGHTSKEAYFLNNLPIGKNIYIHGFVNIESSKFKSIINDSCFVILPSCSEGIATSVITAMGRGGLIPIVSKQCGIDIGDFGIEIEELTCSSIIQTLDYCDSIETNTLLNNTEKSHHEATIKYSEYQYREKMKEYIHEITKKSTIS
ncbi:glycosyltransferase [Crenobacter caeni]|uniref:Glycosyltransferase family 4 protein n=1 Tax=Crenobacter caeni TaxID=2705474 RepID=A0A6B2KT63_9NEIS|nr:glycosyltransferase [Crenobacter caeni]NDV13294.1 glycosyltransferase family 4 protein [Crenobacter caeni]